MRSRPSENSHREVWGKSLSTGSQTGGLIVQSCTVSPLDVQSGLCKFLLTTSVGVSIAMRQTQHWKGGYGNIVPEPHGSFMRTSYSWVMMSPSVKNNILFMPGLIVMGWLSIVNDGNSFSLCNLLWLQSTNYIKKQSGISDHIIQMRIW